MKLGLITDIHEHVEHLRVALARFRADRVEQVVVIGDVFETGERLVETCRLLREARAIGVWGNHDFGLCVEPDAEMRRKYADAVDFMTSLKPRLDVAGCHFTHVEPWLNPENLMDLWYYEGPPDQHGKLARIFDAVPHRLLFSGHFHAWLLATPQGIAPWRGHEPVRLQTGRYYTVIGANCDGRYAILDTDSWELVPFG